MKLHPSQIPPARHNGHEIVTEPDADGGELLARCAAACGITATQAEIAMAFYDNEYSSSNQVGEYSLSEALQKNNAAWNRCLGNIFDTLRLYQETQTAVRFLRMSTRAMALAAGFYREASAATPSELARNCGISTFNTSGKATVIKCVDNFIKQLALAPLPGARTEAAKDNMRKARKAQLK